MCGIFGIIRYGMSKSSMTTQKAEQCRTAIVKLAEESQYRGSRASGICALVGNEYYMYKAPLPARKLVKTKEFMKILDKVKPGEKFRALIGHTRAPTKGDPSINYNNHPIIANDVIGVHNGMISNDDILFNSYHKNLKRAGQVDSEIIFRLIDMYSENLPLTGAVQAATDDIRGSYACAFFHRSYPDYVTLFREGYADPIAVYYYRLPSLILFASTPHIIRLATNDLPMLREIMSTHKAEVSGDKGMRINMHNGAILTFDINSTIPKRIGRFNRSGHIRGEAVERGSCMAYRHGLMPHNQDVCDSICHSCNWNEDNWSGGG